MTSIDSIVSHGCQPESPPDAGHSKAFVLRRDADEPTATQRLVDAHSRDTVGRVDLVANRAALPP
jgi:hypothetical protein